MLRPRLFFVHIQKTAGGTLREYIRDNLPKGSLYPDAPYETQSLHTYWDINSLLSLSPKRMAKIDAFIGHFPYIPAELVCVPVTTMTVLRDPVERTISYLKMRARDPERKDMTPEEIYNHPFDFPAFIHNHQTKIFAMRADDTLETFMDQITMDASRLETAKEHLSRIDILGLQEDADTVFKAVGDRYGWPPPKIENQHVGQGDWEITDDFRARIAENNTMDIEFYNYGRRLYAQRKLP